MYFLMWVSSAYPPCFECACVCVEASGVASRISTWGQTDGSGGETERWGKYASCRPKGEEREKYILE